MAAARQRRVRQRGAEEAAERPAWIVHWLVILSLVAIGGWWRPDAAVAVVGLMAVAGYLAGRRCALGQLRSLQHDLWEVQHGHALVEEQRWWLQRELEVRELQLEELDDQLRQIEARRGWFDLDDDNNG